MAMIFPTGGDLLLPRPAGPAHGLADGLVDLAGLDEFIGKAGRLVAPDERHRADAFGDLLDDRLEAGVIAQARVARPEYLLQQGRIAGHEERVLGDGEADRSERHVATVGLGEVRHIDVVDRGALELPFAGCGLNDLEDAVQRVLERTGIVQGDAQEIAGCPP